METPPEPYERVRRRQMMLADDQATATRLRGLRNGLIPYGNAIPYPFTGIAVAPLVRSPVNCCVDKGG